MWASTSDYFETGRRYSVAEIGALIYPLDLLIDMIRNLGPKLALDQPILQRMEAEEVIFALYEMFHALLEDTPIPQHGHPGYQEALIVELLAQMHGCIETELDFSVRDRDDDEARRTAWNTFVTFLPEADDEGRPFLERWLVDHGVPPEDPHPYRSPKLKSTDWELLLTELVAGEFLRDRDWELEALLDLPHDRTAELLDLMGLDLERAHRLPKSPTPQELEHATNYLNNLMARFEDVEFGG